jgi:hypothetical protein
MRYITHLPLIGETEYAANTNTTESFELSRSPQLITKFKRSSKSSQNDRAMVDETFDDDSVVDSLGKRKLDSSDPDMSHHEESGEKTVDESTEHCQKV